MPDFSTDIDEATADLLLSGRSAGLAGIAAGAAAVADFVAALHATAEHPPARVSPALAAVLHDGLPEAPAVVPDRRPRAARWRRVLTAVGVSVGVAVGGVTAAAAANLLPAGPQRMVGSVVKAVTPFEVPPPSRAPASPASSAGGSHPDPDAGAGDGHRPGPTTGPAVAGGLGQPAAPAPAATAVPAGAAGAAGPSGPSPSLPGGATTVPPPAGLGSPPVTPPSIGRPTVPPTTTPQVTVPSMATTIPTTPATTLPGLPVP